MTNPITLTPAQQAQLAAGKPVLAQRNDALVSGMLMVHIATATTFRILCNCPSSRPAHHTLRYVQRNPDAYRRPTVEETQAFIAAAAPTDPSTLVASNAAPPIYAAAVRRANAQAQATLQAATQPDTVGAASPLPAQGQDHAS